MALPLGAKCIKCLLFTFNLLFVVSGIILIAVGPMIKTPYSTYHYILDEGFFAIPVLFNSSLCYTQANFNILIFFGVKETKIKTLLWKVSGIILIAVGSVIKTPYSAYHYILDEGFFAIPVLLIFIGIIIFIVSFFGCCGAFKENYCLTVTFGISLICIFILEISAGIAGYVLKDKALSLIRVNDLIPENNTNPDVLHMWDVAQSTFHCCGAFNVSEWKDNIPDSCYEKEPHIPMNLYNTTCFSLLKEFFTSNAGTLGGAGIGIAVIQILGILFSYSLATSIGKQYETLEKD